MTFETFFQFLKEYYQLILGLLSFVISVVILIVKRRPVVNILDSIKEDILDKLPVLINTVEVPGNGESKKESVINLVVAYIEKKYKISVPTTILDFIADSIESILSTPQKKG